MKVLAENEAEAFLKRCVPVAKSVTLKTPKGFWKPPFVLQIVSKKALHKSDPAFGHAIMLGTGGTLVELIRDVSFRICPVTERDAAQMIEELKLKNLLYGFRGAPKADVNALKRIVVKISQLPQTHKITEMDINPLIVSTKGAKVVDARIVME